MAENLPSPHRRFQFRLRTLLIGVTILAILAWGSGLLFYWISTNAYENHRQWLRSHGLTDPDFPEPVKK
jgi:hypothetical protein